MIISTSMLDLKFENDHSDTQSFYEYTSHRNDVRLNGLWFLPVSVFINFRQNRWDKKIHLMSINLTEGLIHPDWSHINCEMIHRFVKVLFLIFHWMFVMGRFLDPWGSVGRNHKKRQQKSNSDQNLLQKKKTSWRAKCSFPSIRISEK